MFLHILKVQTPVIGLWYVIMYHKCLKIMLLCF